MKDKQRILLIDDDRLMPQILMRGLCREGYEVRTDPTGEKAMSMIAAWRPDVILLDVHLPVRSGIEILRELNRNGASVPVIMLTADSRAETAVTAMKLGAADYLVKPFDMREVATALRSVLDQERRKREEDCAAGLSADAADREIIGASDAIAGIKAEIERIATAAVPTILITGESGTGKELFARHAHRLTYGDDAGECAPFVRINCAALPEHLLESELFGHEKGAFTDAKIERKGLLELAHGGSLLLDEIGEMKPSLQSKLLRVLEERTVRRVGGRCEIPVQVTIIATTNRDLAHAVDRGEFRMDLFYRLNAFFLKIPPLRERREDIPLLVRHFLSLLSGKYGKKKAQTLSPEAEKIMRSYAWPGNVRELRNIVERAVVLGDNGVIAPEHLPPAVRAHAPVRGTALRAFSLPEEGISLDELEKSMILQALQRTNFNKSHAAKLLRVNYDMIRYYSKKLGLDGPVSGET